METVRIDAAVAEAVRPDVAPDRLATLHAEIVGYRYAMAGYIAKLHKAASQAELDRKSTVAKVKLGHMAHGMSAAKATEEAETAEEVRTARFAEVEALMVYEALRMKWQAAGDVATNLQMRLAIARDEAKRPNG